MQEVIPRESIGLQRVELYVGGRMDLPFFFFFLKMEEELHAHVIDFQGSTLF